MTKLWSFLEKENKRKYSLIVHLQIKEASKVGDVFSVRSDGRLDVSVANESLAMGK